MTNGAALPAVRRTQQTFVQNAAQNMNLLRSLHQNVFSVESMQSLIFKYYERRFGFNIEKNVFFKVNDKTAVLQTDTDLLMEDFERILTTLRRNTN